MIILLAWHGCTVSFASGTKGGLLPLWLAWGVLSKPALVKMYQGQPKCL